jgi:hypothetical protein
VNEVDLGAEALWTLIPISVVCGWAAMAVFRSFSNQDAIRRASNRLMAHLMEFRLFIDEPALILRAQRDLLIENGRLLRLVFVPSLILAVLFFILIPQLESFYGRAPLQPGQPAVVTVQMKAGVEGAPSLTLRAPAAISVETPGVNIPRLHQISWRVRSHGDAAGDLEVMGASHPVTKTIASGRGLHRISEQRTTAIGSFVLHPIESPFSDRAIRSIDVQYPSATILHLHWLVWFSLISSVSAVLLLPLTRFTSSGRRSRALTQAGAKS